MYTEWQITETCKCECGSNNIIYRIYEDDACHEDFQYKCQTCGKQWWIEGYDY